MQGRQCDLQLTVNVTDATPTLPADTSALVEASSPISIQGTQLLGVDGAPLTLKGINFFGYEQMVSSYMSSVSMPMLMMPCTCSTATHGSLRSTMNSLGQLPKPKAL